MNNLMTIVIVASLTVGGASFLVTPSYAQIPGLANLPGLTGPGSTLSGVTGQVFAAGGQVAASLATVRHANDQVFNGLAPGGQVLSTAGQTLSGLTGTTGTQLGVPAAPGATASNLPILPFALTDFALNQGVNRGAISGLLRSDTSVANSISGLPALPSLP